MLIWSLKSTIIVLCNDCTHTSHNEVHIMKAKSINSVSLLFFVAVFGMVVFYPNIKAGDNKNSNLAKVEKEKMVFIFNSN